MNQADKTELVQMIDDVVTKRVDEVVTKRVDEVVTKRIAESEQRILEDMKQLTEATVSQQTADIRDDLGRLEQKVDDIAVGMGEALSAANEVTDEQIQDHEQRITRLEQKVV